MKDIKFEILRVRIGSWALRVAGGSAFLSPSRRPVFESKHAMLFRNPALAEAFLAANPKLNFR